MRVCYLDKTTIYYRRRPLYCFMCDSKASIAVRSDELKHRAFCCSKHLAKALKAIEFFDKLGE